MINKYKKLIRAQLLLLSLVFCTSAESLTPPGTIIYNSAELSYDDAQINQQLVFSSNTSSVSVGHRYDFSVEQTHQLEVGAGVIARFPHTIINQGNTDDSYRFSFDNLDLNSFITPQVILDVNSNGVVDPSEPIITETTVLQSLEDIDVIVTARALSSLANGTVANFQFSVESVRSAQVESITDVMTVGTSSNLDIRLTTSPGCGANVFPGDNITHLVEVERKGHVQVENLEYLLDGNAVEGLVFEVPISENSEFVQFTPTSLSTLPGTKVVKLSHLAVNEWISASLLSDEDLAAGRVTSAGFLIEGDELLPSRVLSFSIDLLVRDIAFSNSKIERTAFADTDLDRIADKQSNITCNSFGSFAAAKQGLIKFVEPSSEVRSSGAAPDLFTDSDFIDSEQYSLRRNAVDSYTPFRDGLYIELTVEDANHPDIFTDSVGNRYAITTLESELTGDVVEVVLLETNTPNVFRSVAPIELSTYGRSNGGVCPILDENAPVVSPVYENVNPSCVLESRDNDRLRAIFGDIDTGFAVLGVTFVNRQSMIFDTHTLDPIEGAVVQVYLADGALLSDDVFTDYQPATNQIPTGEKFVDSVTGEAFEYVTGPDGRFTLPRLDDTTSYYLHVIPPEGYTFPSSVLPFRLTEFNTHGFSYGRRGIIEGNSQSGVFTGAEINARKSFDVPLDLSGVGGLMSVDKVAVQKYVDIGQSVSYIVTINNISDQNLEDIVVEDIMPFGFRYVSGTSQIDRESAPDPMKSGVSVLNFDVGDVLANESIVLSYSLRASAAAIDGNGVNSATAIGYTSARSLTRSLPSTATVSFQRGGVFSEKASLFGKVYVDQNCDGVQNHKEWPIGDVRLYLQDGTYTVTDSDGQYSLYGLEPGQYVVKIDEYTMPKGLDLKLLSVDQTAQASSRFVDLAEGDLHKVDFATSCPKRDVKKVLSELIERNRAIDNGWILQQAESFNSLNDELSDNPLSRMNTNDGDISNGLLAGPSASKDGQSNDEENAVNRESGEVVERDRLKKIDVKKAVSTITKEQAKEGTWLWPENEISANGRFVAVVRSGITPILFVNDTPVSNDLIGERIVNKREKAQIVAWYGVELVEGENTVEVKGTDSFGNDRVLASAVFKRPASGSQIRLTAAENTVPADSGRSALPVKIEILDTNGYPALGVYYITLESSDGGFVETDIQDSVAGRQIRIENGVRTVYYRPSGTTGEVRVAASTGAFSNEIEIHQVAEIRPLVVSGFVEAGMYYSPDSFGEFSPSTDLGSLETEGRFESRAALFIKGTVKDEYNLTLSYDSDKSREQQLLRDINPVLHYPIYGDSSIRGFEAQSRSKLYVRVDHDKNSIMWGDFLTDPSSDARDLARISRALTGLNGVIHEGKNTLRLFAAQENNQNITEEIPGNGSSLLYRLQQYPIVQNSEVVELITRSKDNPGLILDSVRLSRLSDYSVDDDLGYLSFAATIPTLDGEQNPIYVRVTYDVTGEGEEYLVSGARFDRKVSDKLSFGASITVDGHETAGTKLIGLYGDYQLHQRTRLSLALAASDSVEKGKGNAHSLSVDHQWANKYSGVTTLSRVHADENYSNLGGAASAGRTEMSIQHTQKLSAKSNARLLLDGNISQGASATDDRRSFGAIVETNYRAWQVRAGLRQNSNKTEAGNDDFLTSVLGLRRKINLLGKRGETNFEYEQDLGLGERKRITFGGKLDLNEDVQAYTNYERTNSLLGLSGLTGNSESESLILGIESNKFKSTRLYSEYRLRGAFETRDHETASGIRGDYTIVDGLRVSPQFEFIRRFGAEDGDSISASVGFTDTRNPNSRRLLRLETRQAQDSDHYGLRASVATRINNDWTAMVTDNLSRQETVGSETVLRHSFVAALARRPKYNNKHHMLFMYRLRQEEGVTDGLRNSTHVLSTHQNYQFNPKTTLSGRLGIKRDSSTFNDNRVTDLAMLVDARVNHDITRRTSFEGVLGTLYTDGWEELRYSLGLGLNYTINKNARLRVGYNFIGFKDSDLDAEKYNAKGARIGLQYKLDEELFRWLK